MSALSSSSGPGPEGFRIDDLSGLTKAFDHVEASEGTVWLLDDRGEVLEPVWNSGPRAAEFVGKYRHPVGSGLIGLVCATEQALCENAVYRHAGQDPTLDRALKLLTCAMIAVPFRLRGGLAGVVSCVKLKSPGSSDPEPPPFTQEDLSVMVAAVRKLEEAVESGKRGGSHGRGT